MRIRGGQLPLGRRIVASVALGLGLILVLFGVIALWTISDSTAMAYRERVALAQALASRVDDALLRKQEILSVEVNGLFFDRDQSLPPSQRERLGNLKLRTDALAIGAALSSGREDEWIDSQAAISSFGLPSELAAVRRALQVERPQVLEVHSRGDPTKPYVSIAAPAHDAAGRTVGAIVVVIDLSNPGLNVLPSSDPGSGMRAHLLVGDTGPEPGYVTEHRVLLSSLIQSRTAGYRIHEQTPGGPYPSHVVAYAPVSAVLEWGITVEQPQDVVLALPRELAARLALFGLMALLLAAAVAWLDVRRVVQPLKSLTESAERFAAGQFDRPVVLDRSDELGVLAHAFEAMRLQIRTSLAEVAEWNRSALLEPDRVVALVIRKARDLFDSEIAALGLTESGSSEIAWTILARQDDRFFQARIPTGDDQVSEVIEIGRPISVSAAECLTSGGLFSVPPALGACLRSAHAVPLQSQGHTFGILLVASTAAVDSGDGQVALLSRLADQAAVALENARLYREVQGQAALEERERIAREMHDGLGQVLGYVNTKTLAVARLLDVGKYDEARKQVAQLESSAKEVYADVRDAILGLRTTLGPDHDFLMALREYLDGFEQQSGIDVALEVTPPGSRLGLPFAAELQVLRIAQEAMTNVRKHAQATHATVRIVSADDALRLVVEDDGAGFDPSRRTPDGWPRFGLKTMRERAKAIGGTLDVESGNGDGTRVVVTVPRNRREEVFGAATADSAGR